MNRPRRSRRAFTLMELLVVIAIVGVLVGLLLPVFSGARKSAQTARCQNNLKSIAEAFMAYVSDNMGATPMCAASATGPQAEDWIHWQQSNNRKLENSKFAKYLGPSMKTDDQLKPAVLICPGENDPPAGNRGGAEQYLYSYSMNVLMANYPIDSALVTSNTELQRNMQLRKINSPAGKIAFVCESEFTVNDGAWAPKIMPGFASVDWISSRHGRSKDEASGAGLATPIDMEAKANVAFADSHVELVSRTFAHDEKNYNPLK